MKEEKCFKILDNQVRWSYLYEM